ncbi:putative metalloprotease CJM1_0395 family protein [Thalassolituus sp.]|jgi:hypothetical protein|uniref:putative metalloprotease CJM1_0395 family protein n=1 Tax=Thalassolituus sp. TaxID=2030822 RepID=UPI0027D58385|nr:putative metalloprotease CJM1_0395 family protein [Thalassolituus sp.]MDQ4427680.1 putative metalloprotease CJM1_0395 family protein [Thalassolituus sp.]
MQIASGVLFTAPEPAFSSRAERSPPNKSNEGSAQVVAGSSTGTGTALPQSKAPSPGETQEGVAAGERAPSPVAQSDADVRQQQNEADVIRQLQSRDIEVRNHERAHQAIGGQLASAPTYSFTKGPDGQRYAVSGEVSIDVSDVPGDPSATYEKMARVRRAALAPAEPSAQDRQVAVMAAQKMAEAQADIAQQQREALSSEAELRDQKRDDMRAEIESAREAQSGSESEEEDAGFVSVAERFAEYNARLRQINETLLRISSPSLPTSGTLFDEEA